MRDNYGWECPTCHFPGHFCICFDKPEGKGNAAR